MEQRMKIYVDIYYAHLETRAQLVEHQERIDAQRNLISHLQKTNSDLLAENSILVNIDNP